VPGVSSVAEGRILESRLEAIMLRGLRYSQAAGGARSCGNLRSVAVKVLVVLRRENLSQPHEHGRVSRDGCASETDCSSDKGSCHVEAREVVLQVTRWAAALPLLACGCRYR
jgi:hypothetical protein